METRIALIGIIVTSHESIQELNTLLSEYGSYIVGRMASLIERKMSQSSALPSMHQMM